MLMPPCCGRRTPRDGFEQDDLITNHPESAGCSIAVSPLDRGSLVPYTEPVGNPGGGGGGDPTDTGDGNEFSSEPSGPYCKAGGYTPSTFFTNIEFYRWTEREQDDCRDCPKHTYDAFVFTPDTAAARKLSGYASDLFRKSGIHVCPSEDSFIRSWSSR